MLRSCRDLEAVGLLNWALEYHTLMLFVLKESLLFKFILFLPGYLKAQLNPAAQHSKTQPYIVSYLDTKKALGI